MAEKIIKRSIGEACREFMCIFGANKNLYRIIPTMIDGFKPVTRRFIYALYRGKGRHDFVKMSKAAADTTGDYHPHGTAPVEEAAARLGNPITNNVLCLDIRGNYGSYKDEKAAASRYIECKLSKYALKCFFEDFDLSNVDMKLTYTGDDYEPEYLPARYPHLLFNPQMSEIGYGAASNTPPFNVTEVLKATIKLIKDPDYEVFLIPDIRTGADIVDTGQFDKLNQVGNCTLTLQCSVEVDEINNIITITSIPLQITIDEIMRKIAGLKKKKILDEIRDIKDYTNNADGVKCIIYLDPTANPYRTLDTLFSKGTGMRKTYPVGLKSIDDYEDDDYSIQTFLEDWIAYRRDTVRAIFNSKLVNFLEEQNINDVLLMILNNNGSEKVITLAKKSANKAEFAKVLMKTYDINSQQAEKLANMRIAAFTKDAYEGYKKRKKELAEEIKRIEDILDTEDDSGIDEVIIEQLEEGIKLFGHKRRSKVIKMDIKEAAEDREMIVGVSKDGYIKKVDASNRLIGQIGNYTSQYSVINANNKDNIFIFDSTGKISSISVNDIPEMNVSNNGVLVIRYFPVYGEVISILKDSDEKSEDEFIVFLTKKGYIKKCYRSIFHNMNGSTQAIKLTADDSLVATDIAPVSVDRDLIIFTDKGNGIRRSESSLPVMKANARGSRQLALPEGEECVGFGIIYPEDKYIFYLTSKGYAKVTELKYFPKMKKDDDLLSFMEMTSNENLIGILSVKRKDKIVVYKRKSKPEIISIEDMEIGGRVSKASKTVKLPKGDSVVACANISKL